MRRAPILLLLAALGCRRAPPADVHASCLLPRPGHSHADAHDHGSERLAFPLASRNARCKREGAVAVSILAPGSGRATVRVSIGAHAFEEEVARGQEVKLAGELDLHDVAAGPQRLVITVDGKPAKELELEVR